MNYVYSEPELDQVSPEMIAQVVVSSEIVSRWHILHPLYPRASWDTMLGDTMSRDTWSRGDTISRDTDTDALTFLSRRYNVTGIRVGYYSGKQQN